jgi:hypothetical protein
MLKVPFRDAMQELFSGGKPVWIKILGAALIAPVVTLLAVLRVGRKTDTSLIWRDPLNFVLILGGMSILGAVAAACLILKDIVHRRISSGIPVGIVLKLIFGFGIYSFVFIWIPVLLFAIFCVGYVSG